MNIAERIEVTPAERAGCLIAKLTGTLDSLSYAGLRDLLVKLALEEPRALVVDVDALDVDDDAALTVFPTARGMVSRWPGVPIVLAVSDAGRRAPLRRGAPRRFVPVFTGVERAVASAGTPLPQRRAAAEFPPLPSSSARVRRFVREICGYWHVRMPAHEDVYIASELAENASVHAGTMFELRLRLRKGLLSVAVRDGSPRPAVLRQDPSGAVAGYGLRIVADLARAWGCLPDLENGKVVWAVLSPDEDWFDRHPPWPAPVELPGG